MAHYIKRCLAVLALLLIYPKGALSDCDQPVCSTAREPIAIKREPPEYPIEQARSVNGGIVEVEFMVNKNGTVFKPVVTYSTNGAFEPPALKAVRKYRYEPALWGAQPVDARASIRIRFEMMNQQDVVSHRFSRWYKATVKEFESKNPNQKKIEKLIGKMQGSYGLSAYAHAKVNLIQLQYAILFGSVEEKLRAAESALLFENLIEDENNRAIKPAQVVSFRKSMFSWLVQTQRYGQALKILHDLKSERKVDQDERERFDSMAKRINLRKLCKKALKYNA